ncbi:pectinesterase QRT1 [Cucurbita maxima]|uniref:Pectinesterase n=1 Tax=Cucurbita maxima TaxID=3661 RepID=A0A6J1IDU4_CUCMA|nr:pectinesterase QRT1 [Cucurbita maxima]
MTTLPLLLLLLLLLFGLSGQASGGGAAAPAAAAFAAGGGERYAISWDDLRVDVPSRQGLSSGVHGGGVQNGTGTRIIVVDRSSSGDSTTVQGAVDLVPHNNNQRVKIYIRPGIYREKVYIPITKPYISLIGNRKRMTDTVITSNSKASDKDVSGLELGTYRTATVAIDSDYFCASGITFENTVVSAPGDKGRQAVALRISGEKAMFYRVKFLGQQDTLLDDMGTHYFYQCHIQGTIDFIFGTARSLYEQCVITSTAETFGAIAAHHRSSPDDDTGFSFVRCVINGSGRVLLGRAWGTYSRTIYSYCYIEDMISPLGWSDWSDPSRQRTAVFGQYRCRGSGANTKGWVPWARTFTSEEVRPYVDRNFINGEQWLNL